MRDFHIARSEASDLNQFVTLCRRRGLTETCLGPSSGTGWDWNGWLIFVDNNGDSAPDIAGQFIRITDPLDSALSVITARLETLSTARSDLPPDGTVRDSNYRLAAVNFDICPTSGSAKGRTIDMNNRGTSARLKRLRSPVDEVVSDEKLKKQAGVTLIEVLVTLVILSVALTGIAALQITSMQSSTQVKFRSAAVASTQTILEAMRAGRLGGGTAGSLANLQSYIGSDASMPAAATQAGQDYLDFERELATSLRNRNPRFQIAVNNNREVTVTVTWSQRTDSGDGDADKSYSLVAIL